MNPCKYNSGCKQAMDDILKYIDYLSLFDTLDKITNTDIGHSELQDDDYKAGYTDTVKKMYHICWQEDNRKHPYSDSVDFMDDDLKEW